MGLYNMVFKSNPQVPLVLAILQKQPSDFGRFRDAWIEKFDSEPSKLRLAIYTRNGGGNRADYMPYFGDEPLYIADQDDDFDSTYATIFFRMPTEIPRALLEQCPTEYNTSETFLAKVRSIATEPVNMGERWRKAIEAIRGDQ
jgi:hypothetical protein